MKFGKIALLVGLFWVASCSGTKDKLVVNTGGAAPFLWENANMYFLLTDRFYNGDTGNDVNFDRSTACAKLRGFMGGDIKGISKKIDEGYFDQLGVNVIWFTPVVEQIHGGTDEGTGFTYGYHGYWAKDWTRLDPNFGTEADLAEMVQKAHRHGIRVVMDVVVNHTGPVTGQDPVWGADWVRTEPPCVYKDYNSTVNCTLVKNLPDVLTNSDNAVDLPAPLKEKWQKEGRLEQETAELDAFFKKTGLLRAPRFYIYKWLTDYVRSYGFDGYRCDTAKHVEENVWSELLKEAQQAFADWKKAHPDQVLDNNAFFMVSEVYGYGIQAGRNFDFGDRKVDYFSHGFKSMINFSFKSDAHKSYEALFSEYSKLLNGPLKGQTVLNYISSHDDGGPFDQMRTQPIEAANKLLLAPGQAQIYYGDETARMLKISGAEGDANLRSFMNWDELDGKHMRGQYTIEAVLAHWQKLGQFRKAHPAVGAGRHEMLSASPYVFKRVYESPAYNDVVVVGLDLPVGKKTITVAGAFPDGMMLKDSYSGAVSKVMQGKVQLDTPNSIVLLGK